MAFVVVVPAANCFLEADSVGACVSVRLCMCEKFGQCLAGRRKCSSIATSVSIAPASLRDRQSYCVFFWGDICARATRYEIYETVANGRQIMPKWKEAWPVWHLCSFGLPSKCFQAALNCKTVVPVHVPNARLASPPRFGSALTISRRCWFIRAFCWRF